MKFTSACISVALVAFAASILPAEGADWNNGAGGIKEYGQAGVPVPAPVPYQETYKWYLRGDVGFSAKESGKVSATGAPISITQDGERDKLGILSLGFGRYITPSLRVEFGIDIRNKQNVASGAASYTQRRHADGATQTVTNALGVTLYTGPSQNFNNYNVDRNDQASLNNANGMINLYYDIKTGTRFTPYVGAGVGVVLHAFQRSSRETANCTSGGNDVLTLFGVPHPNTCWNTPTIPPNAYLPSQYTQSAVNNKTAWGPAASLMAGGTYSLSERTHWDVGYRMLWQGGVASITYPSLTGSTTIRAESRVDHEVRTGLRFDIW